MSKSTNRLLTMVLLSFVGCLSQHFTASAQESAPAERDRSVGRGGRGSSRSTRQPTFFNPKTGERAEFAQFRGGELAIEAPATPTDQARDTIALTVWVLVVSNSAGPESDELVGQLVDKAKSLPTAVGTAEDVRELVSKLRAARLLEKSREFRLLTTDSQPTKTQTGASQPQIIGTNISNFGSGSNRGGRGRVAVDPASPVPPPQAPTPPGQTNESPWSDAMVSSSIQYRDIGTILELIPRIDATGSVQVQFSYNASDIEKARDVPISEIPGRKPIMADKIVTSQIQSSVRLKSGTAVVVASDALQAFDGESSTDKTQLVILAASVQPAIE